jgi:heptosyltransferase-3
MEQIVVFRPGALGDTLLTFPALAALHQAYPAARLRVVGNLPALALAREAGLADEVGSFDEVCWAALFAEEGIRSARALEVLDGARQAVLWLRDPNGLAARNLRAVGAASVLSAPGRPPDGVRVHAADYLLGTLQPLLGEGVSLPVETPLLVPTPETRRWAEEAWAECGLLDAPVLALHPGSGGRAKCWPPEYFAALAGRFLALGWRVLVIAGPADVAAAAGVLAALPVDRAQVVSDLSLPHLVALLARASLYVGNDSGVSHLSARVGIPTLALFGPTDPAIWAPRGPRAQAVWAGSVTAAGVMLPSMTALTGDVVFDAAQDVLHAGL